MFETPRFDESILELKFVKVDKPYATDWGKDAPPPGFATLTSDMLPTIGSSRGKAPLVASDMIPNPTLGPRVRSEGVPYIRDPGQSSVIGPPSFSEIGLPGSVVVGMLHGPLGKKRDT